MNKMKTLTLQGVTFEVVDEQARADIDVLKENSGSGSGASSWNDLTDKPFGEETKVVEGDTLTWDGNTEGLVSVADMLYKISDNVLTIDDVQNGAIVTASNKEATTYSADQILEFTNAYGFVCFGGVYSVPFDNFEVQGMVFPQSGIYVMAAAAAPAYVESVTIPGYTGFVTTETVIKPIDEKYMPEHLQFGETVVKGDTLTWDGNTEGLVSMDAFAEMIGTLYKISDAVPTLEDCISGATYTVAYYGEQRNFSVGYDEIAEMSGFAGCLCIGDFHAMVAPENNFQIEIEGVTAIFPEAGLYTLIGGEVILTSLTIPNYTGFETTTIRPIDTKYLPEALQFGETVVKSSTLTWDGNTEGLAVLDVGDGTLFYRVSDTPPALADFANGCHVKCGNVINGFAYKDIEAHVQQSGMFYGESWVYLPQDASGAGMTVAKGIYFMNSAESGYVTSLTIPGYNGFETTTIKPLAEQYMPILTSPSGKKFKLSVDDSGVLSATEV